MSVQNQIVKALMAREAYDEEADKIELIQTHISYVFVTRKYVYKIKKSVNLGFLDFTTLAKRRFYCEKEVEINRRLCDDMYLGVVPITKSGSVIKVNGKGKTVEYAVKMKRMPQDKMMNKLLDNKQIDRKIIDRIAKIIAEFHAKAETNTKTSKFGSIETIKGNWNENYEQSQEFVGKTISAADFKLIQERIDAFIEQNTALFAKRIRQGRVRDCHGDIHSGNIFVTNGIYIFDAIEFNERFRYSDVASDVAFLAMDLDSKKSSDLSSFFIEKYVQYSGDEELLRLMPFYKCYRAYVRGKVISFKLKDSNISKKDKETAGKEAKTYYKLALTYARNL